MTNAPRVLVSGVVLGQPAGGVRRHAGELLPRAAKVLSARGGSLVLLEGALPPAPELVAALDAVGAERLTSSVPFQPPTRRWLAERNVLRQVVDDARRADRPFDLLHTGHLPVTDAGLPYVLTLHDLRDVESEGRGRSRGVLRRALAPRVLDSAIRRARTVVTVSKTVRAGIEQRFETRRVVVVPNAGDHLAIAERAPRDDAPILHVGHVERRKNLELLVRALALDPTLPDVVLAGTPKDGEDVRLRALAKELGVGDRVTLLGTVDEVRLPELYAAAAVVVIPSYLEGFGIGVLEAHRAHVPLAISNASALPEVASEGVPSFSPDDPAGAVRAIRAALATPAHVLARNAYDAERYSWQASAEHLVDAWCEAAAT